MRSIEKLFVKHHISIQNLDKGNCSVIDDDEVAASVIQAVSTTAVTCFSWKQFEIVSYDAV